MILSVTEVSAIGVAHYRSALSRGGATNVHRGPLPDTSNGAVAAAGRKQHRLGRDRQPFSSSRPQGDHVVVGAQLRFASVLAFKTTRVKALAAVAGGVDVDARELVEHRRVLEQPQAFVEIRLAPPSPLRPVKGIRGTQDILHAACNSKATRQGHLGPPP